jgi:hypothetical protein
MLVVCYTRAEATLQFKVARAQGRAAQASCARVGSALHTASIGRAFPVIVEHFGGCHCLPTFLA